MLECSAFDGFSRIYFILILSIWLTMYFFTSFFIPTLFISNEKKKTTFIFLNSSRRGLCERVRACMSSRIHFNYKYLNDFSPSSNPVIKMERQKIQSRLNKKHILFPKKKRKEKGSEDNVKKINGGLIYRGKFYLILDVHMYSISNYTRVWYIYIDCH